MLTPDGGSDPPARGGIIYYVVPDLAAAYAALCSRGVAFLDAPHRIARLVLAATLRSLAGLRLTDDDGDEHVLERFLRGHPPSRWAPAAACSW